MEFYLSDVLLIVSFAITIGAQIYISTTYSKYKDVKVGKGLSGSDVAREVLSKNGLSSIYVVETQGNLTDHYDPTKKVIRLSSDIYNGDSVSSYAVSLHEVGHALQYKEGYAFIKFRSFIYPVVNLSSKLSYIAIILGIILGMLQLFYIGIALFLILLLFQLVTLPVEFDASNRALKILEKDNYLNKDELAGARKVLKAAALTYVASFTTSILQIIRLLSIANNRRR